MGRTTVVCHPDGAVERKEYDSSGGVTKEIDPLGYETPTTYNAFSQPLSIRRPDGSEEHFTYTSHGGLHPHIDKNGSQTIYTYDIFDHPIKTEIYSSTGALLKTTSATWSPFNMLSETDGEGLTTAYTYNYAGRKTDEQKAHQHTQYIYDTLGRLSTRKREIRVLLKSMTTMTSWFTQEQKKDPLSRLRKIMPTTRGGNRTHVINSQGITETQFNTDASQ